MLHHARHVGGLAALLGAVLSPGGLHAAPLAPASGSLTASGTLGTEGRFEIRAVLRDGNFSGTADFEIDGQRLSAPLMPRSSFLENGRCTFRAESGRARAEISGPCDSEQLSGRYETFIPGQGSRGGNARGQVRLATAAPAAAAPQAGTLPAGKLTCAYMEAIRSFKPGEPTQYQLRFSNMASLTLGADGSYRAGASASGKYVREGNAIRLTSGPWSGAVGSLEPDRSGQPAVVFHLERNRRAGGVHIVDPYTTRCTRAR